MASATFKVSDVFSLVWSFTSSRFADRCRNIKSEVVTVATNAGLVKGYKVASPFNYHYLNFFGIPYAQPPVGELRFKNPQPFEPNGKEEFINSHFHRDTSMACQNDLFLQRPTGAENCLHLSVFTRDLSPVELKPVMVWIHGGSFILGSNSKMLSNPEYLLRKDVVVFSINYRVGAHGFLSLSDPELDIPGNAGLKDQCLALKWIKANCSDFGGDPENITVFGDSAGGASIHFHMVSEMSKDLFHKAIIMSGTVYAPWALSPIKDWTQRLSKKLGWNGEGDDKACLAVILNASPESVTKAQDNLLTPEDLDKYTYFSFGPTIEPFKSDQCFLPMDPKELAANAWSKDVPLIIGGCSDEALLLYNQLAKRPKDLFKVNLANAVPFQEFGIDPDSMKCLELGEALRKYYFGYTSISKGTLWSYLTLLSDKLFVHPMHRAVVNRAVSSNAPTYVYRFSFSSYSFGTKKFFVRKKVPGACHADDFSYVFRTVVSKVPKRSSKEWRTIERMCESFTMFARTGDPNNNVIAPIKWEPIKSISQMDAVPVYKCLDINDDVSFILTPELDRMHFWDQIHQELKSHEQHVISDMIESELNHVRPSFIS